MTIQKQKLLYQLTTLLSIAIIIAAVFSAQFLVTNSARAIANNYIGLVLIFAFLASEFMLARAYRLGSKRPITLLWVLVTLVLTLVGLGLLGVLMTFLPFLVVFILPILVVYSGVLFFRVIETK